MRRKDLDVDAIRKERASGDILRVIAERHRCSVTTVWHRTRGVVLEGGDVVPGRDRGNILASVDSTDGGPG